MLRHICSQMNMGVNILDFIIRLPSRLSIWDRQQDVFKIIGYVDMSCVISIKSFLKIFF